MAALAATLLLAACDRPVDEPPPPPAGILVDTDEVPFGSTNLQIASAVERHAMDRLQPDFGRVRGRSAVLRVGQERRLLAATRAALPGWHEQPPADLLYGTLHAWDRDGAVYGYALVDRTAGTMRPLIWLRNDRVRPRKD